MKKKRKSEIPAFIRDTATGKVIRNPLFESKLSTRRDQESQPEVGIRVTTLVDVTFPCDIVPAGTRGVVIRVEPGAENLWYCVRTDKFGDRAFLHEQLDWKALEHAAERDLRRTRSELELATLNTAGMDADELQEMRDRVAKLKLKRSKKGERKRRDALFREAADVIASLGISGLTHIPPSLREKACACLEKLNAEIGK